MEEVCFKSLFEPRGHSSDYPTPLTAFPGMAQEVEMSASSPPSSFEKSSAREEQKESNRQDPSEPVMLDGNNNVPGNRVEQPQVAESESRSTTRRDHRRDVMKGLKLHIPREMSARTRPEAGHAYESATTALHRSAVKLPSTDKTWKPSPTRQNSSSYPPHPTSPTDRLPFTYQSWKPPHGNMTTSANNPRPSKIPVPARSPSLKYVYRPRRPRKNPYDRYPTPSVYLIHYRFPKKQSTPGHERSARHEQRAHIRQPIAQENHVKAQEEKTQKEKTQEEKTQKEKTQEEKTQKEKKREEKTQEEKKLLSKEIDQAIGPWRRGLEKLTRGRYKSGLRKALENWDKAGALDCLIKKTAKTKEVKTKEVKTKEIKSKEVKVNPDGARGQGGQKTKRKRKRGKGVVFTDDEIDTLELLRNAAHKAIPVQCR